MGAFKPITLVCPVGRSGVSMTIVPLSQCHFVPRFETCDLYNYLKAYCLRLPLPIHKCKNCGRYFVVTGNITQDYCTRLMEGSEKTCRQMGAVVQYQSRQMKNPAAREFTRSYKAHNARVRYGTMSKAEFTAWSKTAREKRDACIAGKLPLEDFVAWLDSDKQR